MLHRIDHVPSVYQDSHTLTVKLNVDGLNKKRRNVTDVRKMLMLSSWEVSISYNTSHMCRSIGKGVLFKTFDVKVRVQNVPEL